MPDVANKTSFGFISVIEMEGIGHCGGLLIVSQIGRPLEFHCSAPVATNRAQKILYGKTYDSYLYCEQIGLALIDKSKTKPDLLIGNQFQLLELRQLVQTPVAVLTSQPTDILQNAAVETANTDRFEIDSWKFISDSTTQSNAKELAERFTKNLAFDEPFERIQKAIEEAQAVAQK